METQSPKNKYEDKSGREMLAEILRLTLKLIVKIGYNLLKLTAKGIKYIYTCINTAIKRIVDFWNANDTQVKLRIARIKLKAACTTLKHWSIVALKATAHFTVWCFKEIVKAIIHLKPTVQKCWAATKKFAKASCEWAKRMYRIGKIKRAKQEIAYRKFRQHKGFKGLLIDIGNYLKSQIENYMDEEQVEASADANDEEAVMEIGEDDNTAQIIGKRIFSKVKTIVDINEDKTPDTETDYK